LLEANWVGLLSMFFYIQPDTMLDLDSTHKVKQQKKRRVQDAGN